MISDGRVVHIEILYAEGVHDFGQAVGPNRDNGRESIDSSPVPKSGFSIQPQSAQ